MFKIGEQIKCKDMETYKRLKNSFKPKKKAEIKLGDRPENLMKQNAYRRKGRRVHQTKWTE